ncbi:DUF1420 family protein [Leptospira brenneri]|uniref:DUF1420 family protein n=1 Tax=Leptospira brenneri TaxID=2023182 RepID=UPI001438400C|nr:DUF1420 family protein [Leptospira brenneri]
MKYGLDNFIADPPFSAIIGIILVVGLESVGRFFQRFFWFEYYSENRWLQYQNIVFGILLLSSVIFPIALFGFYLNYAFDFICGLLLVFGVMRFKQKFTLIPFYKKKDIIEVIILAFFFLYALVALGPVTNADSLHYHIGVAIETLSLGHFPICEEWFHCRLAGSGEVLNALGLAFGSEQFGSLLQFAGLVSIYGLIRFYRSSAESELGKFLGLLFLTTPILLFLVPSSKPQLYPIALTSFAFVLILEIEHAKNEKIKDLLYGATIALLIVSFTVKFSFILSLAVLGSLAFYFRSERRTVIKTFSITAFAILLLLFPFLIWKIGAYSGNIRETILSPLPGAFYGREKFLGFLRSYSDSIFTWPVSLLIPNSLGGISTILGVGVFFPLFANKDFILRNFPKYSGVISFVVLTLLLGQSSSRFFLEPFLWLIILTKISLINENNLINSKRFLAFKIVVFIQACLVLASLIVGVYALTPGSISLAQRAKVMLKTADGYDLFLQLKDLLPKNAKIVSSSLSTKSLATYSSYSFDWNPYVRDEESQTREYLKFMKDKKITHLIFPDGKNNFEGCYGNIIFEGKTHSANRNPFNPNIEYSFFVAELRYELLPDCYDFSRLKK